MKVKGGKQKFKFQQWLEKEKLVSSLKSGFYSKKLSLLLGKVRLDDFIS